VNSCGKQKGRAGVFHCFGALLGFVGEFHREREGTTTFFGQTGRGSVNRRRKRAAVGLGLSLPIASAKKVHFSCKVGDVYRDQDQLQRLAKGRSYEGKKSSSAESDHNWSAQTWRLLGTEREKKAES